MNLKEQLRAALAAIGPFRGPARTLKAVHDSDVLECELTALDTMACEFTRLAVRLAKLAQASLPQLHRLCEVLAARLNYLLEPIHLIEVDPDRFEAQMRSRPPQREESATTYYELLVRGGGELVLIRYSHLPGEERRVVPAQLTREVLLRLAADFSGAAAEIS